MVFSGSTAPSTATQLWLSLRYSHANHSYLPNRFKHSCWRLSLPHSKRNSLRDFRFIHLVVWGLWFIWYVFVLEHIFSPLNNGIQAFLTFCTYRNTWFENFKAKCITEAIHRGIWLADDILIILELF